MIYKELTIDYDKNKIVEEIVSCRDLFFDIPPYNFWLEKAKNKEIFMVETIENYNSITLLKERKLIKKILNPPKSFYIRSSDFDDLSYLKSKKSVNEQFHWNPKIGTRLEYTKSIIESLPFIKFGLIRAFITENTFLPTHHDAINSTGDENFGISLVPIHSGSPLVIYDPVLKETKSIFSSCFFFDDSYLHGIPMVHGLRIDIRIFGILNKEYV
jgi:hypothetical protein